MKKIRKVLTGAFGLLVGSLILASCTTKKSPDLQAVGDVIVQDIKTEDGVKYGLVVYITANFEMLSAKVTAPGTGGKVYELNIPSGNKYQAYFYPEESDYTTDMPVKGDYSIEVTSKDSEPLYGTDAVGDEKLEPIVIKAVESSAGLVKVTWDKITNADAYFVRVYNADKSQILFSTDFLNSDATEYDLKSLSSGWAAGAPPAAGTTCVIELVGVRVETGVLTGRANNLQFMTVDSKTIQWQ